MIRCFLAINLSNDFKICIKKGLNSWKDLNMKVKWVRPDNLHITLKFLGEIEKEKVLSVATAVETLAKGRREIRLRLGGTGVFPTLSKPRVLWVGLKGDIEGLKGLQNDVENALEPLGFKRENRGFKPHITVGRVKRIALKENLKPFLLFKPDDDLEMTVNKISFMQSILTPKGPIYSELRSFPF